MTSITEAAPIEMMRVLPLPEAITSEDLLDRLDRMATADLPGFVIRSSNLDGEEYNHEQMVLIVQDALSQPHLFVGSTHVYRPMTPESTPLRDHKGLGILHDDNRSDDVHETVFNVHTTTDGEGDVIMMNSKPGFAKRRSAETEEDFYKPLASLLSAGLIDTSLLDNRVYRTHLSQPDTLVMRLQNPSKQSVTVHRFSTSTDERSALVRLLIQRPRALL